MRRFSNFILFSFFIISNVSFAQKEANIWHFGDKAGLDFNSGTAIAITNGQMSTQEGCASIADANGNLLFYTNGVSIWNKDHQLMNNGSELNGHQFSSQSAVITPKPESLTEYYVFTVDRNAGSEGLSYTLIDMTLNGGLGGVTSEININLHSPTCEKITAVTHANGTDLWVIAHAWDSDAFLAYLVSPTGVNTMPVTSNSGEMLSGDINRVKGYMKSSPNGKYIAIAHNYLNLAQLFNFDNTTGIVSNPITLGDNYNGSGPYGVEFSPLSRVLYLTEASEDNIYQYDLESTDIPLSEQIIGSTSSNGGMGAMQIGPDGKIYVAIYGEINIAVINNPDSLGQSADFNRFGVSLKDKITFKGLPTFVQSYFSIADFEYLYTCLGDTTKFTSLVSSYDSLQWNFNDPNSTTNVSGIHSPVHIYSDTGSYNVRLVTFYNGTTDTTIKAVNIFTPEVSIVLDSIEYCIYKTEIPIKANSTTLNATYLWSTGSTEKNIMVLDTGTYFIEVTSQNCTTTESVLIEECEVTFNVPNIFTPNNDTHNDILEPIDSWGITLMRFNIYNRSGKLIHYTEDKNINWDGEEISDGLYYWDAFFIDVEDGRHNQKGHVTILR